MVVQQYSRQYYRPQDLAAIIDTASKTNAPFVAAVSTITTPVAGALSNTVSAATNVMTNTVVGVTSAAFAALGTTVMTATSTQASVQGDLLGSIESQYAPVKGSLEAEIEALQNWRIGAFDRIQVTAQMPYVALGSNNNDRFNIIGQHSASLSAYQSSVDTFISSFSVTESNRGITENIWLNNNLTAASTAMSTSASTVIATEDARAMSTALSMTPNIRSVFTGNTTTGTTDWGAWYVAVQIAKKVLNETNIVF